VNTLEADIVNGVDNIDRFGALPGSWSGRPPFLSR
jgi:hypothetical protein